MKKSLYNLKQSPQNFFLFLKGNLEKIGFAQSESDSCLFILSKVICFIYVDNTLFFAREDSDIEDMVTKLETMMKLERGNDVPARQ